MKKTIIFGLDLSFSSTGITTSYLEDYQGKSINFHKIVYDNNSNKTGKKYTPQLIKNVNIITYRLPTNVLVDDIVLDLTDENNYEQTEVTLKAMVSSKKCGIVFQQAIEQYKPDEILFVFENFIMPAFSGKNQLKQVAGLIMLQGFVREVGIRLCLANQISDFKIFTPTPSQNKSFFAKNGNAEKIDMVYTFIKDYDGNKLLPTITLNDVEKINDVVDSFALMMFGYSKLNKQL